MRKLIALIITIAVLSPNVYAGAKIVKHKNINIPVRAYKQCEPSAKPKIIITTDIGAVSGSGTNTNTDDDDIQSMVHFLVSSNRFDTKGIISSPPGSGRVSHINAVLNQYGRDRPELGSTYPTKAALSGVVRQGLYNPINQSIPPVYSSVNPASQRQGAMRIRDTALDILEKDTCGPLYILVWGAISDLALALRNNPEIAPVLRVYNIASTNNQGDNNAFNYIKTNFINQGKLWFINSRFTFRGINLSNSSEVQQQVKNILTQYGCLGNLLSQTSTTTPLKVGDTPSLLYLMNGDPDSPESSSWGGRYNPTSGNSFFWQDLGTVADQAEARATISTHLGDKDSGVNTVYGDWIDSMKKAKLGCS